MALVYPTDFINKIICGDCIEVMKGIPDNSIDLIITSPPYNLGGDFHTMSKGKRITYGDYGVFKDKMPENEYQEWQTDFLDLCYHKIKPEGNVFYNHKNRLKDFECISPLKWIFRTCFTLRQEIIWDTTNEMNYNKCRFTPCHEKIYWLSKSITHLNNAAAHSDCWKFRNKNRKETGHPATFPIGIVETILSVCSPKNRKDFRVLDPFCGSGTTAAACKQWGLDFIGIEIDPKYIEIAQRRLAQEYLFT